MASFHLEKDLQNKTEDAPDLEVGNIKQYDEAKVDFAKSNLGSGFFTSLAVFLACYDRRLSVSLLPWIFALFWVFVEPDSPLKSGSEKPQKASLIPALLVGVLELGMWVMLDGAICIDVYTAGRVAVLHLGFDIAFRMVLNHFGLASNFGNFTMKLIAAILILAGCFLSGMRFPVVFILILFSSLFGSAHAYLTPIAFSAAGRNEKNFRRASAIGSASMSFLSLFAFYIFGGMDHEIRTIWVVGLIAMVGSARAWSRRYLTHTAVVVASPTAALNLRSLAILAGVWSYYIFVFVFGLTIAEEAIDDYGTYATALRAGGVLIYGLALRYAVGSGVDFIGGSTPAENSAVSYRRTYAVAFDLTRQMMAEFLAVGAYIWCAICTAVAPVNVRFFASRAMQPPGVLVGVAHMVAPPAPPRPRHFQCNVGIMDDEKKHDWTATNLMTHSMLRSFGEDLEGAQSNGLSGVIVAEFPVFSDKYKSLGKYIPGIFARTYKQFNLSGWESRDQAWQWSINSEAHKNIVLMQRATAENGGMHSFSGMLATLVPEGKLIYGIRCRNCTTVSYYYDERSAENSTCKKCNDPLPFHSAF